MTHRDLLPLLLPPVSYAPNGRAVSAELRAEANALDIALGYAGQVAAAVTPFYVTELLADWERVYGLEVIDGMSYQQRLGSLLAKINERGGLSIPYFIEVAQRLGYSIKIDEHEPFYVDYSILDVDRVDQFEAIWVWRVHAAGGSVREYPFQVGASCVGEPLLMFGDPVIETVFEDLKPAHTFVYFDYEEST